jgi:hypothetical protein
LYFPTILVALLAVPAKHHFKGHGIITAIDDQQIHTQECLSIVIKLILFSLELRVHTANNMLCVDGPMRQCYPVVCLSKAHDIENIPF